MATAATKYQTEVEGQRRKQQNEALPFSLENSWEKYKSSLQMSVSKNFLEFPELQMFKYFKKPQLIYNFVFFLELDILLSIIQKLKVNSNL